MPPMFTSPSSRTDELRKGEHLQASTDPGTLRLPLVFLEPFFDLEVEVALWLTSVTRP